MYRNLIPALADRYRVIAPDYPGFGHSERPAVDEFAYTFDALADHVDALLDHLGLHPVRALRPGLRRTRRLAPGAAAPGADRRDRHARTATPTSRASSATRWSRCSPTAATAPRPTPSPARAHQHRRREMAVHPRRFGSDRSSTPTPGSPRTPRWRQPRSAVAVQLELFADYSSPTSSCTRGCTTYFRELAGAAAGGVGPQRPDLRPRGRIGIRGDLPDAEINLLDGGHFLLESRLTEVVALMRPFLDAHLPVA